MIASASTKQGTTALNAPPTISPPKTVDDLLAMLKVEEGPMKKEEIPQIRLAGTIR